jgi:hypothetical protein
VDTPELRVTIRELIGPKLQRLQSTAIGMAVIGAVLAVIGYITQPKHFWESYLFAYMFWYSVTAGSLGLLLLHHTVGGGWGFIIRRMLEAATRLFPLMAVLGAILFLLGMSSLFGGEHGWANPAAVEHDHALQHKSLWLNIPFFWIRFVIYFATWIAFSAFLGRLGATQDERADLRVSDRLNRWSAFGIVLFVLLTTFVWVDWIMSLTPHWMSSIFGLLAVVCQALATFALMLFLFQDLVKETPALRLIPPGYFRDLGNLTLTCTLLWGYMAFSQYVITFSGNTVEEVSWYVDRRQGGWGLVSLTLIPLHFAFPFLMLLINSPLKRDPVRLGRFVPVIIGARFLDLWWQVAPTFRPQISGTFADLGMPLLIGGIWLWMWAQQMNADRPIVPLHDPRFEAHWTAHVSDHGHGHGHTHGHGEVAHV